MREEKIINYYTITINPIHTGFEYVVMEIKTNPNEPHLVKSLLQIPQLKMLDGIFGEFSLIGLFIFRNKEEFNNGVKKIDDIMAESYFKKYQFSEPIKIYKTHGIALSQFTSKDFQLDNIDLSILEILQTKQKTDLISTYDITRILRKQYSIDISQSTTYNRIKKMEISGIILNYTVCFCPLKLGFQGKYIIRIKPRNPSDYDRIALKLEKQSEITHLYRMGSQFGLFAIIRVKTIKEYGTFLKNLYSSGEVEDTFSSFILDEQISFTNFRF
ncbi:MAG: putative HTH-type transcriptional regulator [Promethearchaeota archaeon]|nr:MAG: putative HTH-type transcriptional regulator [Candidatus Lokiarchaeota archaeon]